jgi:hypothetical protein
VAGYWHGPDNPANCDDWAWHQCSGVGGQTLVWIVGVVVGAVVLLIALGVLKWYCCGKKSRNFKNLEAPAIDDGRDPRSLKKRQSQDKKDRGTKLKSLKKAFKK